MVLGINPASAESHKRYHEKLKLNLPLLSDGEREVCRRYGTLKKDGKGVNRTVFIIDKAGVIRYLKQGMPPAEELLKVIEGFQR